jgi:transposase
MKTLSIDLRERIMAAVDSGQSTLQQIADRFMVSLGMVKKLVQQRKRTGTIAARHDQSGRKATITPAHRQQLAELIGKQPDVTLEEMRAALGLDCTVQAIFYVLKDMGLPLKKRRSGPASKAGLMSRKSAINGTS